MRFKGVQVNRKVVFFLVAVILLSLGIGSRIYLYVSHPSKGEETILVADEKLFLDQLFKIVKSETIEEYRGVPLEAVIIQAGIKAPEQHTYILSAAGGYQKTVTWEDLQQGLLLREGRAVLPSLPKQYWIKNLARIEVIE